MSSTQHPENTTPTGEPTAPTRWHPCSICDAPEGGFASYPYIACAACEPGLRLALDRAYGRYLRKRRKEQP